MERWKVTEKWNGSDVRKQETQTKVVLLDVTDGGHVNISYHMRLLCLPPLT